MSGKLSLFLLMTFIFGLQWIKCDWEWAGREWNRVSHVDEERTSLYQRWGGEGEMYKISVSFREVGSGELWWIISIRMTRITDKMTRLLHEAKPWAVKKMNKKYLKQFIKAYYWSALLDSPNNVCMYNDMYIYIYIYIHIYIYIYIYIYI